MHICIYVYRRVVDSSSASADPGILPWIYVYLPSENRIYVH